MVWLLFALGVVVMTASVRAQSGTSSISGRVTDPQGQVVPGASVNITNLATNAPRTTLTNDSGLYQFTAVPPGLYDLVIELSGFKTARFQQVELRVDTPARQDVKLDVGQLAEAVTVLAEMPLLNTVDASLGNSISAQQIRNLPIEARNVVQLLSLEPGTVFIPQRPNLVLGDTGFNDPRPGATNGARADQQSVTLDGVDVNDSQTQQAYTSVLRMTADALQEFKLSTSNYGAEMGRSSGPQVSLVTRSGSNGFTGSAYDYFRRTATSSDEYFLKLSQLSQGLPAKAAKLDKDIFGGAIGGPIRRNRAFFFGNFERLQENSETPATRNVPSASYRDGVVIYQCTVAAQCPGGTVQGVTGSYPVKAGYRGLTPAEIKQIDPLGIGVSMPALQYMKQYPLPNDPGKDGFNLMSYRFAAPITNDFNTYVFRGDAKLTEAGAQNLFVRVNAQDDAINNPPQFPGQPPRSVRAIKNNGFAIGYDSVLSARSMNSFRYGLTRVDFTNQGLLNGNYVEFRFLDNFPAVTATNGRKIPTHNFVDDLSWLKGTHTIKIGTNLRFAGVERFDNANSYFSAQINPSWLDGVGKNFAPGNANCLAPICSQLPTVSTGFTAGYADAFPGVLGLLTQATGRFNYDRNGNVVPVGQPVMRKFAYNEYEGYLQDAWHVQPHLTVTAGLRYSYYTPPWEVNGNQVAPSISLGALFAQRKQMGLQGIPDNRLPPFSFDLAGKANGKKGYYKPDYDNFAPRVSAAWSPEASGLAGWLLGRDRSTIRGGYGIVYDRIGQGIATQFDTAGSFGMSTTQSSPANDPYETNPAVRWVDVHTLPTTVPAAPKAGFPTTPPLAAGVITTGLDDNIVTPYAHVYDVAVSRDLGHGYSFEAAYVGRLGRNVPLRYDLFMPLNLVDPKSGADYFTSVQQLIRSTQAAKIPSGSPLSSYAGLASIPYWENLWAPAAGGGMTATQVMARQFNNNAPDYITALYNADEKCRPACSIYGKFAYFDQEYDSLGAIGTFGHSRYDALQLSLRKRFTEGYQFDFNYTLGRSKDQSSQVERGSFFGNYSAGGSGNGFLVNSWDPEAAYSYSDFDVRHQLNLNWVAELPVGRGRHFGRDMNPLLNQLAGGWSIAGLTRWTSGFPFNVANCRSCWATNWNVQGNSILVDPNRLPATDTTENVVSGYPSPFPDPQAALGFFRRQLPGETGIRNLLRGDGYFTIDLSVSKAWSVWRNNKLRFRWDTFNLTNTPRFDVGAANMTPDVAATFGRYTSTLATCDAQAGRCMQFALRYEFQ